MDYSPPGSSLHGILQDTGVGCHFLLQGIFLTQGLNPSLLHSMQIIYLLSHQGSQREHLSVPIRKSQGLKQLQPWQPFHLPLLHLSALLSLKVALFLESLPVLEGKMTSVAVGLHHS